MTALRREVGISLIELGVSIAIAAMIIPIVAGIIFIVQFSPGRSESDISAQQDVQNLGRWINYDANRAETFSTSSLASNEYGVFGWVEYGGTTTVSSTVIYFYDTSTTSLIRRFEKDGVLYERTNVARNIAAFEDVNFAHIAAFFDQVTTSVFTFRPGQVTVSATSTVEKVGRDPAAVTATAVAQLRGQFERSVAAPGAPPLVPGVIAREDWETGDFADGAGWLSAQWTVVDTTRVQVRSQQGPFEGVYHLRIRNAGGKAIRDVNLSGRPGVHLTFQAKVNGFEPGDTADIVVNDGSGTSTVKTFTSADSDDIYKFYDLDLSAFTMTSPFYIAFQGNMTNNNDHLFIDDITVLDSTPPAAPTSLVATAGDLLVSLDWDDNTENDIAGYNVYQATVTGGPYTKVGSLVPTSDYIDTSVVGGTTYFYVVRAENTAAQESPDSNEDSATPFNLPPAPPTSLVAVDTPSDDGGAIDLTWTVSTSTDVTEQRVYRSVTSTGPYSLIQTFTNNTSTSHTDTGLTDETTFYYVIRSYDGFAESGNSNEASATPLDNLTPAAPTSLSVVDTPADTGGAIDLAWTPSTAGDVTEQRVYRSVTSTGPYTLVQTFPNNTTSTHTDTGLTNGITYYYVIRAFDGTNESGNSNEAFAIPINNVAAPQPPANLVAVDGPADQGGEIDLTWTPSTSTPVTEQRVYRATVSGGPYSLVQTFFNNTTTSHTDTGLTNGTTYYYVIRAFGGSEESTDSNEDSATPIDNLAPAAPANLVATAGDQQVSLNWDNNSEPDLAGYNVHRSTGSGGPYSKINVGLVSPSAFTDTGVIAGITYYYVVTAEDDSANESGNSNEDSATPVIVLMATSTADAEVRENNANGNFGTIVTMRVRSRVNRVRRDFMRFDDISLIPAGSTIVSATSTLCATSVPASTRTYNIHRVTASWVETTITWNNQPAVAGAATDSATTPASPDCSMSWDVATDVQTWVSGTTNDGWRVSESSEDDGNHIGIFRSRENTTAAERPKLEVAYLPFVPPTNLTAIDRPGDTGGVIDLAWTPSSSPGVTEQRVYRSVTSTGPYTLIQTFLNNTTSTHADTGLTNGTTYYYVVRAFDGTNESGNSNEAFATPINNIGAPAAPTNLTALDTPADQGGSIDLTWTVSTSTGVVEQRLLRSVTSTGPYTQIQTFPNNTTSTYTDTGLTNGTTYYYVARAHDGIEVSANSNEASAAPVDNIAPAAPTNLAATAGDAQVLLDWDDNTEPDLAGYNLYRSVTSTGPYTQINVGLLVISTYTDTTVTAGVTYYYVVRASDGTNESANSNEASATPFMTATFTSIADAEVRENSANNNFGSNTTMRVRSRNNRVRRDFFEFDISSITAGSTIISATSTLCATSVPGSTRTYDIHQITASWVESTITWNNQPAVAGGATDSATTPASPGCMTWDIATDVQAWVDGAANNGWRVSDDAEDSGNLTTVFRARENGLAAERPTLDVAYSPP